MIRGLIFDLDGVLTETASIHYEAWRQEVKKYNINFTEKENAKLKGLSRIDTLNAILKIHKASDKFNTVELQKICDSKNTFYKKLLETKLSKHDILPGIQKLLDDAKKKGLKLAIASSSYNAPTILKKLELIHYFDYIVNPADVKNGKPAPDIFLNACDGIGLKPHETIGFEDAIAGVQGLVAAKIKTIAITYDAEDNWEIANMCYSNTNELNLDYIMNNI